MVEKLLIGLLVGATLYALQRAGKRAGTIDVNSAKVYLPYSWVMKALFWTCSGISLFVLTMLLAQLPSNEMGPMWFLILFFGAAAAYLGREIYGSRIYFNQSGVYKNTRTSTIEIAWSEMESAQFKPFHGALFLKSKDGKRIKVSNYRLGFNQLVEAIEHQTAFDRNLMEIPF